MRLPSRHRTLALAMVLTSWLTSSQAGSAAYQNIMNLQNRSHLAWGAFTVRSLLSNVAGRCNF